MQLIWIDFWCHGESRTGWPTEHAIAYETILHNTWHNCIPDQKWSLLAFSHSTICSCQELWDDDEADFPSFLLFLWNLKNAHQFSPYLLPIAAIVPCLLQRWWGCMWLLFVPSLTPCSRCFGNGCSGESLGGGGCVCAPCYKRTAHLTQLIRSLLQRVTATHGTLSHAHSHEAIISQMHANVCMYSTYALYNVEMHISANYALFFLNNTPTSNV